MTKHEENFPVVLLENKAGSQYLKRSVIKGTPPSFVSGLLAEGRRRTLLIFT